MDGFHQTLFKFEYWFCPTKYNQIGQQNAVSAVVVTLFLSFLIGFLPNFIYGLLPSKSRSCFSTGLSDEG